MYALMYLLNYLIQKSFHLVENLNDIFNIVLHPTSQMLAHCLTSALHNVSKADKSDINITYILYLLELTSTYKVDFILTMAG